MKRLTITLLILSTILLSLLPACDGLDDAYSGNPTYRLSFSQDTVVFDTVFTTVGSSSRKFMIYNPNNEPLNIESVLLAGADATGFRMNLDGRKGNSFSNVMILPNDSIYAFVEVTVNPDKTNQPLLMQDSVIFTVNGIRQSVLLEAYGQDVNLYKGGVTISRDLILKAGRPYLIYDSLVIAGNTSLTIEKGATFYMHDKANIVVYGSINALGTKDEPITFQGDRQDDLLNDRLPYDRTPGQWGGIFLKADSYGNVWDNVTVRNGSTGVTCELSIPGRPKIKINHSRITHMSGNLFSAINCDIVATDTEFSNAGGNVMTLIGGKYHFVGCTMANFTSQTKQEAASQRDIDGKCLYLAHNATVNKSGPYPITQAYFDNCIIDGSYSPAENFQAGGEIETSSGKIYTKTNRIADFNYRFNHCVLKAREPKNDPRK